MFARLLAILIVAAALVALLRYSQTRHEPLRVSGFVEADEIRVGSRVGGRVAEVHCTEGQLVKAGQVLLRLEEFDLDERRAQAEANLAAEQAELDRLQNGYLPEEKAQAKARVDRLAAVLKKMRAGPLAAEIKAGEARVELARAQLERGQASYNRMVALFRKETGTVSREDVDRATEELKVAEANHKVRQEEQDLLVSATPRPEDILAAEAELEEARQAYQLIDKGTRAEYIAQAKASAAAAQAALNIVLAQADELEIKAPLDGVVEALELQKGDLVSAGAPVLSILDVSHLWVRAYVPENRLSFRLNDEVRVVADNFSTAFRGRISFLASQAEFTPNNVQTPEERSKQVFRIKVTLVDGLDQLRPGMPADVLLE
jgi:multidrug resistance efflux pump